MNSLMYKPAILELIARCQAARRENLSPDEIRLRVLPENAKMILQNATDFLNWVQDDKQYCSYYHDALADGVCAKPVEVAASILQEIIHAAIMED